MGTRWALAMLLVALSSGVTPSHGREAGRGRPIDLVRLSVDRVLTVVQSSPPGPGGWCTTWCSTG